MTSAGERLGETKVARHEGTHAPRRGAPPVEEVFIGVENGDQVILNPPVDLEEGSKVHVRAVLAEARP